MAIDIKKIIHTTKTLKLLYVEDDDDARKATLKLLNNFFTDITISEDGQDALDKLKEAKYDLILSDINMPNKNGLEMLEELRHNGDNTPTIFLSAHNESEYFTEAIKLGIEYFILKPIQQEQFVDGINKIVQLIDLKKQNEHYKNFLEDEILTRTKELKHKLHFDSQTKLLNRFSFFENIQKIEEPLVFLLDIDKFRMINEVYGNNIGSHVLNEFSLFLLSICNDTNKKAYRISGDEFAILGHVDNKIENEHITYVESFFNKLNDFTIDANNDIISLEVTVGISSDKDNTFESAEVALEFAKDNKLRYKVYSSKIDKRSQSTEILKRKNMIRLAIEQNRIVPVYQGIVDKSQNIVKYETLMRIKKDNSDELISPYYFLDVAIKTSLYDKLSYIIIFDALKLLQTSLISLSINFTYSDIKNVSLMKEIDSFFSRHPYIGERAIFEITEDESIKNYDDVKNFIKHFQSYGVRVAIDDFGTGFSNFEHILELEPNYLKIDGSLIKNIDNDPRSYTLVQAIVKFSHKLGIKVISEFVHNEVVFEMLKELDVDEYQGFYFCEPRTSI